MGSRPKRSLPRVNYKRLNNWGTSTRSVQFSFQKTMAEYTSDDDRDTLDLSLTEEEQREFAEEGGDEVRTETNNSGTTLSIVEAAQLLGKIDVPEGSPVRSAVKTPSTENEKRETETAKSDTEDLQLRVQLLTKKRDDLKKAQLKETIKTLEMEVQELQKGGQSDSTKKKKKSGEVNIDLLKQDSITIKDLRKSKQLNEKVNKQLARYGFGSDENEQYTAVNETTSRKTSKKVEIPESGTGQRGKSKYCTVRTSKLKPVSDSDSTDESDSESDMNYENLNPRNKNRKVPKSKNKRKSSKYVPKRSQIKKKERTVSDSDSDISESDSDSDSSSSTGSQHQTIRKSSKKKQSGIVAKATDKVKNPQLFPHNYLQFEYVNKDIKFKQLNFKQFVAGELEIISNFCENKAEKEGRMKLLQKIAYYSSIYQWAAILDFYAAWLRQIEIGRKSWKNDPQVLESAILTGNLLPIEHRTMSRSAQKHIVAKPTSTQNVWFCYKYQRNKCDEGVSPHSAVIRGSVKTVHHICATCLQKDGARKDHPECSDKCPNKTQ